MITVNIIGQEITVVSDTVVSDSAKYLTAEFICSEDWKGYFKKAIFTNGGETYAVVLEEGNSLFEDKKCYVPFEVIKHPGFEISVVGNCEDSVITTAPKFIPVIKSGELDGAEPKDPTPDQYAQIIDICAAAQQVAASVRADADNGLFKGEKGDKGDKGEKGPEGIKGDRGPEGKQGPVGPKGPQGEKGEKGDSGEKGDKGDNGLDGNVDYSLVANTLKGKKSGESVSISDVSPLEHNLSVKVENGKNLTVSGKNLFDISKLAPVNTTINGVTYEQLEDGRIHIYGKILDNTVQTSYTSENSPTDARVNLPVGIYSTKRFYINGKDIEFVAVIYHSDTADYTSIDNENRTLSKEGYIHHYVIYVHKEITEDIDLVIPAQLEFGATSTEYEPYAEIKSYPVNSDGTVHGVKSIYPTTVLFTDTEGATIEAEYNKDINKAFCELQNAIINLGGTI